ncbi:hypothetical protein CALVIDRAFT_391695 [Calocera viscosa TUFC12733]|uniref:C2H2-type domain-containing protein n=1 Tax=Calocera viscosa (strain TUFC12733) TaxID=1330018 RepID=A0A167GFE4_CALVF|nr:hypothetical protein CALVIDRAFT_391695 [Calocera viscosa TUFC12733]
MELSSILNPETEDERRDASAERWDDPDDPPPGASGSQGASIPGRKYPCKVCERVFTTSGHLSRHMKVHTGERKYVCPFPGCDVKCNRSDNLLQHYRVHLPKEERKLGNSHIRDSLRRMNSYASSSSSTSQVSPGVAEPTEYIHAPSHSPTIRQSGSSLSPQHATTSHYPGGRHFVPNYHYVAH